MGPDCTGRVKPAVGSQPLCLSFPISKEVGLWWRLSEVCRSHHSEQRQPQPHPSRCPPQQNVGGSPSCPPPSSRAVQAAPGPGHLPTHWAGARPASRWSLCPEQRAGTSALTDGAGGTRHISRGDSRSRETPARSQAGAVGTACAPGPRAGGAWPRGRSAGCAHTPGHLAGHSGVQRPWGGCPGAHA